MGREKEGDKVKKESKRERGWGITLVSYEVCLDSGCQTVPSRISVKSNRNELYKVIMLKGRDGQYSGLAFRRPRWDMAFQGGVVYHRGRVWCLSEDLSTPLLQNLLLFFILSSPGLSSVLAPL